MPLYEITAYKSLAGHTWVNTYQYQAVDLPAAIAQIPKFVTAERNVHYSDVMLESVRVSRVPNPTLEEFYTEMVGELGLRSKGTAQLAPIAIVAFVKLEKAMGRPGKKFYRFALSETDFAANGTAIRIESTSTRDAIVNALNTLRTGLQTAGTPWVVGKSQSPVTGITLSAACTQQVRHGWYNRARGGGGGGGGTWSS